MSVQRTSLLKLLVFMLGLLTSALLLTGCSDVSTARINGAEQPSTVVATETLKNLQTAYNGESNARARYLAFAEKADSDGYGKVASLFRAAARSEEIHANNHSKVISKLGGTPAATLEIPEVKDTAANLDAAIKGESYERDTMYPDFLKQARQDGSIDAVRTFNLARNAETEHAKLYGQALNNLSEWKGEKQVFYVCPVCGFTATNLDFERCPSSYTAREKFLSIN